MNGRLKACLGKAPVELVGGFEEHDGKRMRGMGLIGLMIAEVPEGFRGRSGRDGMPPFWGSEVFWAACSTNMSRLWRLGFGLRPLVHGRPAP